MQIKLSQIGWLEAAVKAGRGQRSYLSVEAAAGQPHCQTVHGRGCLAGLNVYLQTSHTRARTHTHTHRCTHATGRSFGDSMTSSFNFYLKHCKRFLLFLLTALPSVSLSPTVNGSCNFCNLPKCQAFLHTASGQEYLLLHHAYACSHFCTSLI